MRRDKIESSFDDYRNKLISREIKGTTIEKYERDVERLLEFMGKKQTLDKQTVMDFKEELKRRYRPASVNSYLIGVNGYLRFLGREDLTVKPERIQKRCSMQNVLDRQEYERLLDYAKSAGKWKYYCIMKTLSNTGIRVGELRYITRETVRDRLAVVRHKGKVREILITEKLAALLLQYCEQTGIESGAIFCGRRAGVSMDATGIWKGMKRIARSAGVDPDKVYPHSFRHLFAKTYMRQIGNLTELSDILGHSSIETTRIYTLETVDEKRASLARLTL